MAKFQSVKKICEFVNVSISNTCIDDFVGVYKTWFRSYRFDNTPVAINKAIGLGFIKFSESLARLKPDLIVVLGDRFEAFAAAAAAMVSRIPIAHIAGGESTFGIIDEAFRHSMTKMSHLHFTATEEYRKRVIQLGESPDRVFNVGSIGLDNIKKMRLLTKFALEKELHFKFNKRNILVTFHPVTLEKNTSQEQFGILLIELDNLENTQIIFTKANADTDGKVINKMIDEYVAKNSHKAIAFTSMGQLRYLSTMQFIDAVVGNSSSGIVEAPSFKIGSIDIGDRQKGRIRAKSVIYSRPTRSDIRKAFRKLYSAEFRKGLKHIINPYDARGGTAHKIKNVLRSYNLDNLLKKSFYNIDFSLKLKRSC